jgi:elongation factor G
LQDRAQEARDALIETVVEIDEAAMEAYLEGEEPSMETERS